MPAPPAALLRGWIAFQAGPFSGGKHPTRVTEMQDLRDLQDPEQINDVVRAWLNAAFTPEAQRHTQRVAALFFAE